MNRENTYESFALPQKPCLFPRRRGALQFHTRDTFGNAIKSTYAEINGVGVELFKDPVTDSGVKKSARGLLRVEKEGNDFVLYERQSLSEEAEGELRSVFHNGEVLEEGIQRNSVTKIRKRLLEST